VQIAEADEFLVDQPRLLVQRGDLRLQADDAAVQLLEPLPEHLLLADHEHPARLEDVLLRADGGGDAWIARLRQHLGGEDDRRCVAKLRLVAGPLGEQVVVAALQHIEFGLGPGVVELHQQLAAAHPLPVTHVDPFDHRGSERLERLAVGLGADDPRGHDRAVDGRGRSPAEQPDNADADHRGAGQHGAADALLELGGQRLVGGEQGHHSARISVGLSGAG
jgi:hypothetical protein